jgi:hypothetical protein
MRRRLVASLVLAVALLGALQTTVAAAPTARSEVGQECKHGGWRNLTGDQGQPFKNQGQCIKWRRQHPVGLGDLTGAFTGTQSFTFTGGLTGCQLGRQVIDASYPGSSAVGTVTLHLEGCIDVSLFFRGTFTLATSAGTLSGTSFGQIRMTGLQFPFTYELTLDPTSATGVFSGIPGQLHLSLVWPGEQAVTGEVTLLGGA